MHQCFLLWQWVAWVFVVDSPHSLCWLPDPIGGIAHYSVEYRAKAGSVWRPEVVTHLNAKILSFQTLLLKVSQQ